MISKINYYIVKSNQLLFLFFRRNSFLILFFLALVTASLTGRAVAEISFTETTQDAGFTYTGPTWGAQWTDFNGDGWPDIWVTNHESKEPSLYLNMQDGTFDQISDSIWAQMPYPYRDTHGAGWADFDNDGDQDVLVDGGTTRVANYFFVNDHGLLYEEADQYGLSFTENRGRMPLWLDYDNDGLLDVYINGIGTGVEAYAALFKQNSVTGIFENANSLVGFSDHYAVFSMLSDLSGDGVLDIISYDDKLGFPTAVYSTSTIPFTEHRNELFPTDTGYVADAAFADFNGDLRPDVYVTRSGGEEQAEQVTSTKVAANIIEKLNSEKGISFKSDGKVTILFSLPYEYKDFPFYIGSSGLSSSEFTGDIAPDDPRIWGFSPRVPLYLELDPADSRVYGISGHISGVDAGVYIGYDAVLHEWRILSSQSPVAMFLCKFIAESETPITDLTPLNLHVVIPAVDTLYMHNGSRLEKMTAEQSGITGNNPGRSVIAGDFDNDMDLDIYVVESSRVMNVPNILYENDGTGFFTRVPDAGGAAGTLLGAGDHVIAADYNRDGFLDLFVTNGLYPSPFDHLGPLQLFRNNGNNNHWIEIDLVGTTSNRDGIGARVLLTAGGKTQLREQGNGMHKYSQNHKRIHFGLGQNTTIERLEIHWPSGIVQVEENLAVDAIIQVVESTGGPQPPQAANDTATTYMDTPTTVDVLANDYDPNASNVLAIAAVQNSTDQGGVASVNDNGTPNLPSDDFIEYTPPAGFAGTDTFTYTIDDGTGFTDTASVIVMVKAIVSCDPNGAPIYDANTEDGIFLWKEGNIWHLRAIAGFSGSQRYIGSLSSDMDFINVTPVNIEANDILTTADPKQIAFTLYMSRPNFDGIDFEVPSGATVNFDIQARFGHASDFTFIGGDRCSITQLPIELPTNANTPPVAVFSGDPVTGVTPLLVNFDASASYDPDADGMIVSYAWDYGDGTGSGASSSHTYNTPGTYVVTLTVTDDDGATGTASQTIVAGTSNTCNPSGTPSYDPAAEDGVFLWQDGNTWHLRAVAGLSGSQTYTGSIVSNMGFSSVTPVSLEANDFVDTTDPGVITFKMIMSRPYFDGLDFAFPEGAVVSFNVQASNGNATSLVFIGGGRCSVGQLPYQLATDEATCNLLGEPAYAAAVEDGVFLWKEGNIWHLRGTAGSSGWHRYTGSITSDMDAISVTPVDLESFDSLDTSNPQEIVFDLRMTAPWFDGVDFEFPAGASVHLDVQADTGNAADLVFVGGGRCPVDQLPYLLPSF